MFEHKQFRKLRFLSGQEQYQSTLLKISEVFAREVQLMDTISGG